MIAKDCPLVVKTKPLSFSMRLLWKQLPELADRNTSCCFLFFTRSAERCQCAVGQPSSVMRAHSFNRWPVSKRTIQIPPRLQILAVACQNNRISSSERKRSRETSATGFFTFMRWLYSIKSSLLPNSWMYARACKHGWPLQNARDLQCPVTFPETYLSKSWPTLNVNNLL